MKKSIIVLSLVSLSILSGCSNHDPAPVSECPKIVDHAKKVMGKLADSRDEMMKDCKGATDQQRGCVKVAKSAFQVSKCLN